MERGGFQYRVCARTYPVAHVDRQPAKADVGGAGCASAIALVVGAYVGLVGLSTSGDHDLFTVWQHRYVVAVPIGALVAAGCTFVFSMQLSRKRAARNVEAAARARQAEIDSDNAKSARSDAEAVTRRLYGLLAASYEATAAIPAKLEAACAYVTQARREFRERAYAPFWSAVEYSAELLTTIAGLLQEVSANARDYQRLLVDREHNFPQFPVAINMLPDPRATADALHSIVRLGQVDDKFADIQVKRQTSHISLGDFRTIDDMLVGAPAAVIASYNAASGALRISSDVIDPRLAETLIEAERLADLQRRLLE